MRLVALLLLATVTYAAAGMRSMMQLVNHFDGSKDQFVQYWDERTSCSGKSTVFVRIIDQFEELATSTVEGTTYAPRYNACYVHIFPRGAGSSDVPQFKDLSIANALMDIKVILEKEINPNKDKKVVLTGMGYGGMLAALFRQEFPSLSKGALLNNPQLDFPMEFGTMYVDATAIIQQTDPACAVEWKNVTDTLNEFLLAGRGEALKSTLALCSVPELSSARAKAIFWHSLMYRVVLGLSQPNPSNSKYNSGSFCKILKDKSEPLSLKRFLKIYADVTGSCIPIDLNYYASAKTVGPHHHEFAELKRMCDGFGRMPVSRRGQFFMPYDAVPDTFFGELCSAVFGPGYDLTRIKTGARDSERTYGGASGYSGTNTIFTICKQDPYFGLSPKYRGSASNKYYEFEECARGKLLYPETGSESQKMKDARFDIQTYLDKLLA